MLPTTPVVSQTKFHIQMFPCIKDLTFSKVHKKPCTCSHIITPPSKNVNKLPSNFYMLFKFMIQPLALSNLKYAQLCSHFFP